MGFLILKLVFLWAFYSGWVGARVFIALWQDLISFGNDHYHNQRYRVVHFAN